MLYKNSSESTGRAPKKPTPKVESARTKNQWLIQLAVNCALCMGALVLLGMPLPANAQTQVGAQTQGGVEVTSANVPQDMILPSDQFKGIHFYQSDEFFSKFSDRKSTPSGLYLLDTELVPKQLPVILAKNNVALGPDGAVVNQKGEKVVLILGYRIAAVKKNPVDRGFSGLTGQMSLSPRASPFPLEWVSYWYSWNDDEGFCRSMTSTTGADAWGPIIDPAGDRVHTNIDYIEAVANAADAYVDHYGFGISWEYAQAYRDFGCFWPAHGGGQWGWVYFQDGSWNWYASW